jgi:putative hydrolase of the HAD superfamily
VSRTPNRAGFAMKRTIRGIGFDLGETLIFYRDTPLNWSSLYPRALASVAKACEASPDAGQLSAASQILARYNTRIVPRTCEITADEIFSQVLLSWELEPAGKLGIAIDSFFSFFQRQSCAYPDVVAELERLRERGVPLGILTDVPYGMPRDFVQRDLDRAGISGLFNVLLTSIEVGVRKPDPRGYLALAARLGIAPEEMLYVGNEAKDIIGARRAQFRSAFLDRNGSGANHGQDFTLSSLTGIAELVALR